MKTKVCATCKIEKEASSFKIIRKTGSLRPYCNPCQKKRAADFYQRNKEKINKKQREYMFLPGNLERRKFLVKRWHYKKNYGITMDEVNSMILNQEICPICNKSFLDIERKLLHVDHCHRSGLVRSILCHKCNLLLGACNDNVEILKSAISYVKNHNAMASEMGLGS